VAVLFATAVTGLILGGNWVLHRSFLAVRHIDVMGAHHETTEAVLAASGLEGHPAMIDVHSSDVAAKLRIFPWVDTATVSRSWPSTVSIHIHEHHVVGVTSSGNRGVQLISEAGTDLGAAPLSMSAVRLVADPSTSNWVYATWGRPAVVVASSLPVAFRDQVYAIHVSRQGAVTLQLTSPVTFFIGDTSNLHAKYLAIASVIAHATLVPGDRVDVSVPTAVTISH
jgi:cell division protein FtsQ